MSKKKIVVLGLMSKMPVGGNIWLVLHYLIGLQRLGYEPYYVESHGCPADKFSTCAEDNGLEKASGFIHRIMKSFGLEDRWAYHAIYNDNLCFGMTRQQLFNLYGSAAAIINLHGGTELLSEHLNCPVRIYLGTDPVDVEVHVHRGEQKYIDLLEPHTSFFTWGLNYGRPDCSVPTLGRFDFQTSCPPVIMDWWASSDSPTRPCFTTIGNYRQGRRNALEFEGRKYHWSKHFEFQKFIDLPQLSGQPFELALSRNSFTSEDLEKLQTHGWLVCDALEFSSDLEAYGNYIKRSRGEFTVAKDQNIRLRSGWFSERSTTYLAAGRPVITQDTGFGSALPTGNGLFSFSSMDDILNAVQEIDADYEKHSAASRQIARDYFSYDRVLPQLLSTVGV